MQPQEQSKGLKNHTIALMVVVALFYDALQLMFSWIGLGWLILPVAYGTFMLWFKFYGISFLSMKRAPTHVIGSVIELISAGIIPALTLIVLRVAISAKVKKVVGI